LPNFLKSDYTLTENGKIPVPTNTYYNNPAQHRQLLLVQLENSPSLDDCDTSDISVWLVDMLPTVAVNANKTFF